MSKETKKKGTKKPYQKPEIVFEDFSLTTNIAAGCEVKTETPNNSTCGYIPEGHTVAIFIQGISGCTRKVDDDLANGFCYHVPESDNNLFNS